MRKVSILFITLATLTWADDIDEAIIKDLEFFSNLEVIDAMEILEDSQLRDTQPDQNKTDAKAKEQTTPGGSNDTQ